MRHAGIELLSESLPGTSTGTVIVLTTPDANRTFLSYLGSSQTLTLSAAAKAAISRTRVLIVEGYLWEMPGAQEAIGSAVRLARDSGAVVALTTGDPGLVARHRSEFWRLLKDGSVDVLFANRYGAPGIHSRAYIVVGMSASEACLHLRLCGYIRAKRQALVFEKHGSLQIRGPRALGATCDCCRGCIPIGLALFPGSHH